MKAYCVECRLPVPLALTADGWKPLHCRKHPLAKRFSEKFVKAKLAEQVAALHAAIEAGAKERDAINLAGWSAEFLKENAKLRSLLSGPLTVFNAEAQRRKDAQNVRIAA